MILSGRQHDQVATVGECQDADFLPVQSLLQHQFRAGFAEFPLDGDPLDGIERILSSAADDDSLTSGQAIGFHDPRHILRFRRVPIANEACSRLRRAKHVVIGGRYIGGTQQLFAEDLAGFQLRRLAIGTEDAQAFLTERIDDAVRERPLRTDHGQANFLLPGEADQPLEVGRVTRRRSRHRSRCRRCRARQTRDQYAGFVTASRPMACSRPPFPITRTFIVIPYTS